MSAIFILLTAIVAWIIGTVAGYMLWGVGWGTLVWVGLTALFAKQLIMATMLAVAFMVMGQKVTA